MQAVSPWCRQQQPNQWGQEAEGSLNWDTCWSLDQHDARGVILPANRVNPWWCLCKKKNLFFLAPLLSWGPTEYMVGKIITSGRVKTHAPEVENPCPTSEPCLNQPPQCYTQSSCLQDISTTRSRGVLSVKDKKALITAEHQRVFILIVHLALSGLGSERAMEELKAACASNLCDTYVWPCILSRFVSAQHKHYKIRSLPRVSPGFCPLAFRSEVDNYTGFFLPLGKDMKSGSFLAFLGGCPSRS